MAWKIRCEYLLQIPAANTCCEYLPWGGKGEKEDER